MKNIDKVTALLSELGVGFEHREEVDMAQGWVDKYPEAAQKLVCKDGMDKVDGYCGFITEFYFDADGKFVCMGIWE